MENFLAMIDYVKGKCLIEAAEDAWITVKVTDMVSEEVLVMNKYVLL